MVARILDSGGIPPHLMALSQALRPLGWTTSLAFDETVGDHPHGPTWFEEHGITVHRVPFLGPRRSLRNVIGGAWAFVRMLLVCRRERPDVIHVHFRSTSIYAQVASLLTGVPFVTTLHLADVPRGGLFRLSAFWGSRAIAISSETYTDLAEKFSVDRARIALIHNGADAGRFRPPTPAEQRAAREALGLDPDTFTICSLGRLREHKRHVDVIDAVQSVIDAGRPVQCVIAGDGELRADIEAAIARRGLQRAIRIVGYTDPQAVYWASDVHVLASLVEGFPLVVVEAMLAGVPTIRTPAAGTSDQITDGVTGFVVDFKAPAQIANRLCALIDDPDLLSSVARRGRESALDRFTAERMTRDTLAVYTDALQARRRRPARERSGGRPGS
jgi:glycosyltransferase involved in cell wall biosynthesis